MALRSQGSLLPTGKPHRSPPPYDAASFHIRPRSYQGGRDWWGISASHMPVTRFRENNRRNLTIYPGDRHIDIRFIFTPTFPTPTFCPLLDAVCVFAAVPWTRRGTDYVLESCFPISVRSRGSFEFPSTKPTSLPASWQLPVASRSFTEASFHNQTRPPRVVVLIVWLTSSSPFLAREARFAQRSLCFIGAVLCLSTFLRSPEYLQ